MGAGRGPVRPSVGSRVTLGLAVVAVVVLAVWARAWIQRAPDPARTLALAGRAVDGRLLLRGPLDVAWNRALDGAGEWNTERARLAASVPPPMCLETAPQVARIMRVVDAAAARDDRTALHRALDDLRGLDGGSPAAVLVVAYDIARGLLAAGDPASAARELTPVLDEHAGEEAMPTVNLTRARAALEQGQVSGELAAVVYHARFLAGTIAYERGEMMEAVLHFRRGLNALNYVIATDGGAGPQGHYEAFAVDLGSYACSGGSARLGSMDGYAALVRTYLAADGFSDPWSIRGELRRGPFDLDRNDPLAPVIRYAQNAAPDFEDGPIPERFIWAASNLQRVYHHNRLRPDPRLEAARGVLILELADRPEWLRVLSAHGAEDACALIRTLGAGLLARADATPDPGATDSALAAVAIAAHGQARERCGAGADDDVDAAARSRWLLLGGGRMAGGLPAIYEARRRAVLDALASRAPEEVVRAALAEPLDDVWAELRAFESGRTPAHLAASIPPDEGLAFVRSWWRSLFRDAGSELLERYRGGVTPSTAEAPAFLRAVNGATAHAGARPSDLYSASELAPLARSQGDGAATSFRLRHWLRSHPLATAIFLVALSGLLCALALVVFVNWWRFTLLTRGRLYAGEVGARYAGTS